MRYVFLLGDLRSAAFFGCLIIYVAFELDVDTPISYGGSQWNEEEQQGKYAEETANSVQRCPRK